MRTHASIHPNQAEYEAKLSGARESVPPSAVEAEEALLAQVDKLCMVSQEEKRT